MNVSYASWLKRWHLMCFLLSDIIYIFVIIYDFMSNYQVVLFYIYYLMFWFLLLSKVLYFVPLPNEAFNRCLTCQGFVYVRHREKNTDFMYLFGKPNLKTGKWFSVQKCVSIHWRNNSRTHTRHLKIVQIFALCIVCIVCILKKW